MNQRPYAEACTRARERDRGAMMDAIVRRATPRTKDSDAVDDRVDVRECRIPVAGPAHVLEAHTAALTGRYRRRERAQPLGIARADHRRVTAVLQGRDDVSAQETRAAQDEDFHGIPFILLRQKYML